MENALGCRFIIRLPLPPDRPEDEGVLDLLNMSAGNIVENKLILLLPA